MSDWMTARLGDVADILVGYAFKSAQFAPAGNGLRLLRGVNVHQGFIDWRQEANWPMPLPRDLRYELAEGDVVLAMDRPWIEAGLKRARLRSSDLPALLVQRVSRLRGTELVLTSFIHHTLATEQFSRYLQGQVTGATVPHISQSQIASYELALPPVQVQARICGVLDAIDGLIENNCRRVEVLEAMARSIYREWFVHFRYPGHETVPLVDSPLGPIPEGWEVSSVAETSAVVTRGIAPKYSDGGPSVVLNQKCIRDERVSFARSRRQERPISDVKLVRDGDVLINSTGVGTLGRVAYYRGGRANVTVDSHVTIARPGYEGLNPWYGLSLVALQSEFERLGAGSTGQTELGRGVIGALPLYLPPTALLELFAARVRPLLLQGDQLVAQGGGLGEMRNLLLPKLVTGQIDVSTLDLDGLLEGAVA